MHGDHGLRLLTGEVDALLGRHLELLLSIAVFGAAWIGQFIGHVIERRKPAFVEDVRSLLVGPVCLLLAVSVIGIAVVPFVIIALFAAWIVGKVGVARWIGRSLVREDSPDRPLQSARSFVLDKNEAIVYAWA